MTTFQPGDDETPRSNPEADPTATDPEPDEETLPPKPPIEDMPPEEGDEPPASDEDAVEDFIDPETARADDTIDDAEDDS